MFGSTDYADSAGQPWEGREFEENPFANDDGSASEEFETAITTLRGSKPGSTEAVSAHIDVIEALRGARLLVPLLAEAGDVGVSPTGLVVDKTQELAIVTVAGPSGQKVLPVFSCVETMQNWNAQSRPVPVQARKAALAAVADGASWMVVDPGSSTEIVIKRPELEAIAQGLAWVPAYADIELAERFQESISRFENIQACVLFPGDTDQKGLSADLVVQLALTPGLKQDEISALLNELSALWSAQEVIAQRVDSMKVQLVSAS